MPELNRGRCVLKEGMCVCVGGGKEAKRRKKNRSDV